MRPSLCEYCGQTDTKTVQVRYLFGILTCDEHHAWGIRDCNAYMHNYSLVRMSDAMVVPGLSEILQMITNKNLMFPVVRSNGNIEIGWRIYNSPHECIKKNDGDWYIPCVNDELILKPVKLTNFLRPDVLPLFPVEFPQLLAKALSALNAGVYAKFKQYVDPVDVVESPCVKLVQMPNGELVRAFTFECN